MIHRAFSILKQLGVGDDIVAQAMIRLMFSGRTLCVPVVSDGDQNCSMRELHGVMFSGHSSLGLKRRALLFDAFHIWHLNDEEFAKTEEFEADLAFLRSQGLVVDEPPIDVHEFAESMFADAEDIKRFWAQLEHVHQSGSASSQVDLVEGTLALVRDNMNRMVAVKISKDEGFDLVPVCELSFPDTLPSSKAFSGLGIRILNDIATVTLSAMPVPDESCSSCQQMFTLALA